jgi:PAS domain S-box-containing protein
MKAAFPSRPYTLEGGAVLTVLLALWRTGLGGGAAPAVATFALGAAMALATPRAGSLSRRLGMALAAALVLLGAWVVASKARLAGLPPVPGLGPFTRFGAITEGAAALALFLGGGGTHPRLARRHLAAGLALVPLLLGAMALLSFAVGIPLLNLPFAVAKTLPAAWLALVLGLALLPAFGPDTWPHRLFTPYAPEGLPPEAVSRTRKPLIAFISLVLLVWAGGSLFLRSQLKAARKAKQEELAVVAGAKGEALAAWYQERMSDALRLQETPLIQRDLLRVLDRSPLAPRPAELLGLWAGISRGLFQHMVLFDAQGQDWLSLRGPGSLVLDAAGKAELRAALQQDTVTVNGWGTTPGEPGVHLSLWIPVRPPGAGPARGALLIRMDAREALLPILAPWPNATPSLRAFLAVGNGNGWLPVAGGAMAGELTPLTASPVPGAAPALAANHSLSTLDAGGVPVLATVRPVPGTPWSLLVKVDEAEAYSPLRQGAWITGLGLLGLVALGALGIGMLVSRDHAARMQDYLALETQHRVLMEVLPEAAYVIVDGTFRSSNPAGLRLFGAAGPDQLLGTPYLDRVQPQSRPVAQASMEALALGHTVASMARFYLRMDGTSFWGEITGTACQFHGEPAVQLVIRDITDRRAMEHALLESEERYRYLVENQGEGVSYVDREERFTFVNPAGEAIFGVAKDGLLGRSLADLLEPAEFGIIQEQAGQRRAGKASSYELAIRRPDGSVRCLLVTGKPHLDDQGRLQGTLGIFRDITDQKRVEAERRELANQLAQSQKLESLGSLAGGVAHDINNVLGAILALASAHRQQVLPPDPMAQSLDTILTACLRGREVVKSLLYFARKDLASIGPVDLNALGREMILLLDSTTLKRVEITTDLEEALPVIEGDQGSLSHALMNLFVNALDAMPEGGVLCLRTRVEPGGGVAVTVTDNGHGMTPEVKARALEPFYTTKPQGKGTGLGLAMVFGTVKAHQGTLEIQSEPGRGTAITLHLPAPSNAPAGIPVAAGPAQGPVSAGMSILVVDDDDLIRLSMAPMLQMYGHAVQLAASGEEALTLFERGLKVDLVILDMNMPGLNGAQTLARLLAIRPDQRVLMASGYSDESLTDLVAPHPRVLKLRKPFTAEELQGMLGALAAFG